MANEVTGVENAYQQLIGQLFATLHQNRIAALTSADPAGQRKAAEDHFTSGLALARETHAVALAIVNKP